MSTRMTTLSDSWTVNTCKRGQGAETCSYLMMGPLGWHCAKENAGFCKLIDEKRATGNIRAMADNCSGPPLFQLTIATTAD